jgi:CoA-transferase family III
MKGFLTGPYENRAALDEVVQMMGGLAYMTGPPGRPLRAGASVNDIMGGMFAAIGILAAVNERHRTGRGRSIKAGLFENCMYLMAPHMMQFTITGRAAAPMPDRLASWAVYDIFDLAGGSQIFIGVVTDTQWTAFCDAFDLPALKADPALATNRERVQHRERFMPQLRAMFGAMAREHVLAECERIGLPFARRSASGSSGSNGGDEGAGRRRGALACAAAGVRGRAARPAPRHSRGRTAFSGTVPGARLVSIRDRRAFPHRWRERCGGLIRRRRQPAICGSASLGHRQTGPASDNAVR